MIRKILTIDDDEDVNNLVKLHLKKHNFHVETCNSIEEFFKKVVDFKPHLCLVDLNLDNHDGFGWRIIETIRKKIGSSMIIIVMSRRNSTDDINRSLECGANDYIQKPIDENILLSKINVFLDKNSDEQTFPDRPIPTGDQDCFFDVPLYIDHMNEESIFLYSNSYIGKGSLISLKNDFFKGTSFGVKSVTKCREKGGYLVEIHLDQNEHDFIMPQIRRILIETPPLAQDETEE